MIVFDLDPVSATFKRTSTPGIYRRGGRYVVMYRDRQGQQRKRSAKTLAEARVLKATITADVVRGEHASGPRLTFAQYAEEWIQGYAGRTSRGLREATRRDYSRSLERDALPFFGRMKMSEIEPRDVKRFAAEVAGRGVSRNTVRLALAPLRALLATAVEDGVIRSNPAAGVRLPHVPEPEDADRARALTEAELERLIVETPAEWRPLVALLATTGLRISEALALRWRDVDLGKKRVLVRRSVNGTTFSPPKSRYGQRDVPLAEGVARALWEVRKASPRAGVDELVFGARDGQPLDRKNLFNRVLKPAARRAGVPWAGFHTLRHTCATMLFRSGLNAKQVQVWLGHHSPAFTLDVYVHLLPDDLPEPVDPSFVAALQGGNKVGTREAEIGRKPTDAQVAV